MKELESDLELLGSLSGALEERSRSRDAIQGSELVRVLNYVQERSGIMFNASGMEMNDRPVPELIANVCDRAGVRWRKIRLEKGWHKCDSGILLVIAEGSGVYAGYRESGAYRLYDGKNRQGIASDEVSTDDTAFVVYKSFGTTSISFRNLVFKCVKEIKKELILVLLLNAGIGVLSLFLPVMIGVIFQGMLPESNIAQLKMVMMGLFVSGLAVSAFHFVNKLLLLNIESRLNTYLQSALWDRLLNQPVTFFRKYPAGELTQMALGINTVRQLISGSTIASLIGSLLMIFYFVLLMYYSIALALIAVGLIAVFSTINFILLKKELHYQEEAYRINGQLNGEMVGYVNAVSKLKLAASESSAVRRWTELFAKEKYAEYNAGRFTNWVEIINIISPLVSGLLLYSITIYEQLDISTATFIAFHATFSLFLAAGVSFSSSLLNFFKALPLFRRLQPIIECDEQIKSEADTRQVSGSVELRQVTFRYEGQNRAVLDQVDIQIKPGEFIGITGASGCGKSTLIRLLLGFNPVENGSIYIDGNDISKINMRPLRKHIGVILQSDGVMAGSILENIRGAGNHSLEEVERAIDIADLREDIQALPMGLNTMIPYGGGSFSGGQLQRILIARAIVGKPRILIMDEATSALDAISQEKISRALDKLKCTRIVIAHRLITLAGADRLFELKDGQLLQRNLMKSGA